MPGVTASVTELFDYVLDRLKTRIEGMDDHEYFWEPAEGCWSLRLDESGTLVLDGEGGGGPAPEPVPITTIAWRLGHLGGPAMYRFATRVLGEEAAPDDGLVFAATAAELPEFLDRAYQPWREALSAYGDDDWRQLLGPDWGPHAEASQLDLVLHIIDEVIHHAAEVGLMRDFYSHRQDP